MAITAATLEAQVIALVAEFAEVKPDVVLPSTRLLHDLGMDGDVAVDFFNRVHERFGTDLTHLHARWSEHFGPEGLPCTAGLIFIPAGVVGALVGSVAGPVAATVTVVASLAATVWAMPKLGFGDWMTPITVGEVVSAVEAGQWPPPV